MKLPVLYCKVIGTTATHKIFSDALAADVAFYQWRHWGEADRPGWQPPGGNTRMKLKNCGWI